jgi:hypothetical protein
MKPPRGMTGFETSLRNAQFIFIKENQYGKYNTHFVYIDYACFHDTGTFDPIRPIRKYWIHK